MIIYLPQWLKKYGLKKIKLKLAKYVSGPACLHEKSKLKSCNTIVSAKFCNIFPSTEIDVSMNLYLLINILF